jgi:hypothetical protein
MMSLKAATIAKRWTDGQCHQKAPQEDRTTQVPQDASQDALPTPQVVRRAGFGPSGTF